MHRKRFVVATAAVGVALLAAGCTDDSGSSNGTSSPPATSAASKPAKETSAPPAKDAAPGEVTSPGTELSAGDSAIVPFNNTGDEEQNIKITVTGVRTGTIDDFSSFPDAETKLADITPYYVDFEVEKADPAVRDLAFNSVSQLNVYDQNDSLISSLGVIGSFPACEGGSFGKDIDTGTVQHGCKVVGATASKNVTTVKWVGGSGDNPYDAFKGDPIVWSVK